MHWVFANLEQLHATYSPGPHSLQSEQIASSVSEHGAETNRSGPQSLVHGTQTRSLPPMHGIASKSVEPHSGIMQSAHSRFDEHVGGTNSY